MRDATFCDKPFLSCCLQTPQGNGPLAEIDYWRERNAALSALFEQLKLPKVKQLLDIFSNIDNSIEYLKQDLSKYYTEAKDNVRFLSTLERHFKNITHGATFQVNVQSIKDCCCFVWNAPWPTWFSVQKLVRWFCFFCLQRNFHLNPSRPDSAILTADRTRHAAVADERAAHGVDHFASLQQRRAHGAAHGAHRVGTRRARRARHSSQNHLQVRGLCNLSFEH